MLETVSSSVRESVVSSQCWSNGSSSSVEDPPLSLIPWLMVLDSNLVLMSSDVLMPEEGSVLRHS